MTYVFCTTRFEGYHRWKNAPDDVAFLRDWHRHIFHVKVTMPVNHDDRDIEFIRLKRAVESYLLEKYAGARFEESCEQIAKNLLRKFDAAEVEVSEDGENGALVSVMF